MKLNKTLSAGALALAFTFSGLAIGAADAGPMDSKGTASSQNYGAQAECGAGSCGADKKKDKDKDGDKDKKKGEEKGDEKKCGAGNCGAGGCG